jgi:hypothetical protein
VSCWSNLRTVIVDCCPCCAFEIVLFNAVGDCRSLGLLLVLFVLFVAMTLMLFVAMTTMSWMETAPCCLLLTSLRATPCVHFLSPLTVRASRALYNNQLTGTVPSTFANFPADFETL